MPITLKSFVPFILPQVLVTPADAYYNVLGPMPIGLIAALPMLAAAVWLTLREMKQEEKN